jgi:hypothetical protein
MPNMNLGFSSFRVCGLRLQTKTRCILLLDMFRFGSLLLHLMMMLKARCEPRFWACKFHRKFLCTLEVCASSFCLDYLFESLLLTLVIACRESLLWELAMWKASGCSIAFELWEFFKLWELELSCLCIDVGRIQLFVVFVHPC